MTDATNCSTLLTQYNQRRQRQLLNIPPTRLTPVSPYPMYTQFQLNMRRKAEILQYSGNKQNTKTNSSTKAEKWAQIVSGNSQRRNNIKNIDNCSDAMIMKPTSSSNVPGKIMNLYYDPSIPLYNNNPVSSRTYAILMDQDTAKWGTNPTANNLASNNVETALTPLLITKNIDNNYYTFSIRSPIGIYLTGNIADNTNSRKDVSISIKNVSCNIYYGSDLYSSVTPSFSFANITLNTTNSDLGQFSAAAYVGDITINNVRLPTISGFIYNIKLTFEFDYTIPSTYFNFIKIGALMNLSTSIISTYSNCVISTVGSTGTSSGFSISGIKS